MNHKGQSSFLVVALLTAALFGLGAKGCGDSSGLKSTLFTPASPATGLVDVSFELADPGGKPASVALDFSTDGGLSYSAAAISGTTSGLTPGKHALSWHSLTDLGATKTSVILRIKPSNAEGEGTSSTSGSLLVDNTVGSNSAPTISISDPTGETTPEAFLPKATYYGHLLVSFTLADAEGDVSSVKAEYSTDGGKIFLLATPADDASMSDLVAPADGKSYSFLWDSKADLGAVKTDALIRLTASDSKPGSPALSGYLPIHNTALVVERGPYLQAVTPTSMMLIWTTAQRTTTIVDYGPTSDLGTVVGKSESTKLHVIELTGLATGSYYSYMAYSSGTAVGGSKFRTTPGPGTPISFVCIGDSGAGLAAFKIFVQEDLAKLMTALEPDLLIHTGDVVYPNGEQKDYTEKYFTPYKALGARTVAFPSLGNHDMRSDGVAYLKNFFLPTNNPKKDEKYYSFDYGDVHFVALDSTAKFGPTTEQGIWLEADLAKTLQPWKVVYFHHAVYSSGRHGSSLGRRADLAPTMVKYGVDLVLTGHDHHYERTKSIDGTVYIVTGGGGAPLYPYKKSSSFTHTGLSEWHFVHVKASTSKLEVKAISVIGKTIDSFSLSK